MRLAQSHAVDIDAEALHNNMMIGAAQAMKGSGFRAIYVQGLCFITCYHTLFIYVRVQG